MNILMLYLHTCFPVVKLLEINLYIYTDLCLRTRLKSDLDSISVLQLEHLSYNHKQQFLNHFFMLHYKFMHHSDSGHLLAINTIWFLSGLMLQAIMTGCCWGHNENSFPLQHDKTVSQPSEELWPITSAACCLQYKHIRTCSSGKESRGKGTRGTARETLSMAYLYTTV